MIQTSLFKNKRTTVLWLRWLLIIALSYLMLFHTGRLNFSWEINRFILLYSFSNIALIALPKRLFDRTWFDLALITIDSLMTSVAMIIAGLSSTYLLFFYFLIILLTTMGKGSGAVVGHGLIMVGVYLIFLLQTQSKGIWVDSSLLLPIPFLILCTVFYAVLVDQADSKQHLVLERMKSAEASQNTLRTEVKAKEEALRKVEDLWVALRHQALHDHLTELPNRTLLFDRLQQAIHIARREKRWLVLIMMDLDHFKEVNDTMGHHTGDLLLKEMASRLREILREADTIARLGGDEFGILSLAITDVSATIGLARRIVSTVEKPFEIGGYSFEVGASLGIALYPDHGTDVETLMRHADIALYAAKRTKSGFTFYDNQDQHTVKRLSILGELRHAIDHEELLLFYQPKVEFKTGRIYGVEALVRWHHPKQGLVSPAHFVPIAEQTGLIKPLSSWVRNAVLRQWDAWHQAGIDLTVAINISASSLQEMEFPERVAKMLKTYGVPPAWLELELTESAMMMKPERAIEVILKLRAMDVQISIDDFGTGYSSLAYLARLPAASIKIDKSFVMNMMVNNNDAHIVRAITELGHNLGFKIVAEGVENKEIWDRLAALGCDAAQGYYLSRPLPAEELTRWLYESPWGLGKNDQAVNS